MVSALEASEGRCGIPDFTASIPLDEAPSISSEWHSPLRNYAVTVISQRLFLQTVSPQLKCNKDERNLCVGCSFFNGIARSMK